jgi:MoxR-like ATPase
MDDVLDIAPAVLRHRMALHFAARAEGKTLDGIIAEMCQAVA